MIFSLSTPAKAQSLEDLQALIAQLQAQIAALTGGSTGSTSCPVLTQPLTIGSSGASVTALQTYLIADGESIPAGATGYFGTQTQAAVAAWQAKNAVAPAAGYWGPISLAKYNAVCTTTGGGTTGGSTSTGDLKGGEASLDNFDAKDGDDTDLQEGQDDAPVMDVTFDVDDGDISIDRVDVAVDPDSGNTETDPWDAFDNVSIWVDGDKIADKDVDSKSDWSKDEPNDGDYRVRLTGLDWVVREGDTAEFTVAFTVANGVVDSSETANWDVFIPTDGIRATDAAGVNQYIGDTDDTVSFDIEESGSQDELKVRTSSDDPDATTFSVDSDTRSDWITILAFDLDSEDSINDIQVNSLQVDVDAKDPDGAATTTSNLINDARIVVDGKEVGDATTHYGSGAVTASTTVDLDDDELTVEAGDRVTVEYQVRIKAMNNSTIEGSTLRASVDSADIDAEGSDDLDGGQLSGSVTGEEHTFRTQGVSLDPVSDSATVQNAQFTGDVNKGIFTIKFDVTAFEDDAYIAKTASSTGNGTTTAGIGFQVEDANGDAVGTTGTTSASVTSTADSSGSYFLVHEGDTETFTLNVSYDPATGGYYHLQLLNVNYNDDDAAANAHQMALPQGDYETDAVDVD
jgi:peptidoglycan hydrolase-like protein with peptidoglycan-binding domain